ncbi:MAG: glutamine synthetase [Sulfuritalea sp.]|nr:glutamine synthetase [Sulfuritalea sp.]
MSFVERFGLWTDDQRRLALELPQRWKAEGIELVRFAFADQHGILRGKTLVVSEALNALSEGVAITTTLFAKDTSHRTVFPVFSTGGGFNMPEMQGAADAVMVADPATFKRLPWAPNSGWLLCDTYFRNGKPVPFDTRRIYREVLGRLAATGHEFLAGLEVEFHVFKILDPKLRPEHAGTPGNPGEPPSVELLSQGYQYLTEQRYDMMDPVCELIRRDVMALGLPLRSLEVEFGPSQIEFTFAAGTGLTPADDMVLLRSAVKQICRRHGYHATFMCRPKLPNIMSSGWHLHQSLRRLDDGGNAFVAGDATQDLSPVGRHYLAGLLAHAQGATALSTPTINGYKRYRPNSLAPDRVLWGRDNRGAMIRLIGGGGDPATHLENRIGEPAANPYLYFASQIIAGMDGMARKLEPPASADMPYDTSADILPRSLDEALGALRADPALCAGLGEGFVNYFCHIKAAEIARFNLEVSDWEHREYFEMF